MILSHFITQFIGAQFKHNNWQHMHVSPPQNVSLNNGISQQPPLSSNCLEGDELPDYSHIERDYHLYNGDKIRKHITSLTPTPPADKETDSERNTSDTLIDETVNSSEILQ